jgi:pyocin large subunit-like protein
MDLRFGVDMAAIIPFIPLIAAGIGAATTAVAIAHQPDAPKAETPAKTATQESRTSEAAAQAQAAALTHRRGMASTVLTSPFGSSTASTQKATLGA